MARSLSSIAVVAVLALLSGAALAQSRAEPQAYPARPIRIIVPNTAGSATDVVSRMVAQRLTEAWGQQMVVDNRAGASGIIGHEIAAKAAPDGYTLLVTTSAGLVINPLLTKIPYDPARDFAPISLIVISPQMLVSHPGLPAGNVEELVALARAKPGQLNCASPGTGTSNHLGCEMLKVMAGIDFLHVPYKGTSPAITDVMGGQVQFMFNSMPAVWPLAKAGKLRALAHGGTRSARERELAFMPHQSRHAGGGDDNRHFLLLAEKRDLLRAPGNVHERAGPEPDALEDRPVVAQRHFVVGAPIDEFEKSFG